jgi:nucleoside phosphorylase
MIAIIAPVGFESDYLESCLSGKRLITLRSREIRIGKINKTNVMIVNSGMGKVNSAHTTTLIF